MWKGHWSVSRIVALFIFAGQWALLNEFLAFKRLVRRRGSKMLIDKFGATVLIYASAHQWDLTREYFALIRDLLNRKEGVLTWGQPQDKPITLTT